MKILLHSNAPWSASGYGQQAAMFAPRLADSHEVGISAFQGLVLTFRISDLVTQQLPDIIHRLRVKCRNSCT